MTRITYTDTASTFDIEFIGHSGYGEHGQDIVCAAISILVNEMIMACWRAEKNNEIINYICRRDDAFVNITFDYHKRGSIRDIIYLILDCLKLIAEQYRDYVKIVNNS